MSKLFIMPEGMVCYECETYQIVLHLAWCADDEQGEMGCLSG